MKIIFRFFFIFILSLFSIKSFSQEIFKKGSFFVGGDFGLSFYNKDLAYINQQTFSNYELDNALRFSLLPKINYGVLENTFITGHLGLDYSNYKRQTDGLSLVGTNYKIGGGLKYYFIQIIESIYLSSELGMSYNYYRIKQRNLPQEKQNQNYISAYFDVNIDLDLGERWLFSITFKDLIVYNSQTPNPKHEKGMKFNNIFKDFIRYPHFSVFYKFL